MYLVVPPIVGAARQFGIVFETFMYFWTLLWPQTKFSSFLVDLVPHPW